MFKFIKKIVLFHSLFVSLATFVVLPAAIIFSIYSLEQQGFFKIDEITVNISVKPSQKFFIKPYLDSVDDKLAQFKGQSLWKFSLKNATAVLRNEEWIEEFRVSRSWPSGLQVEIIPYKISYLIQSAQAGNVTEFFPVTYSANVLKKIDSKQAPAVAIVRGEHFLKNQKIREGVNAILNSLPENGKLQASLVSEVGYDKKDGFWINLIQTDVKIKYGDDQFEIKSSRVSQVMDYLENRDLKARVIDANLSKKVLVRLH